MSKKDYLKRKESIIIKDFETAFSCYNKLVGKVANIRQWTVTVMIGLIVIYLSDNINLSYILIPVSLCFLSFLILELRERSSMRFDKKEILDLELIFMIKDEDKYYNKIEEYEFRDLRLRKLSRKKKVKHLVKSIKTPEILFWYLTWVIVWFITAILKVNKFSLDWIF